MEYQFSCCHNGENVDDMIATIVKDCLELAADDHLTVFDFGKKCDLILDIFKDADDMVKVHTSQTQNEIVVEVDETEHIDIPDLEQELRRIYEYHDYSGHYVEKHDGRDILNKWKPDIVQWYIKNVPSGVIYDNDRDVMFNREGNAEAGILYIELDDHDTIYLETTNGCIGFYEQWTTAWNFRIYQRNFDEQGLGLNDKVIKEWIDFTEDNYSEAKKLFKEMTGLSLPTFAELCEKSVLREEKR